MRLALYTGLILAGGYTCLTPALAADPTGDWRVADAVANIRVAQCNGSMWGAVSWEKQPGGRDEYNPDASKKTRPTLGMATLIDMKKKPGVDQWEGQVYNAQGRPALQRNHHDRRHRPARNQGLRDGLPLRRRDLDPRRPADSFEHRQRHGQGRAEAHRRGAESPRQQRRHHRRPDNRRHDRRQRPSAGPCPAAQKTATTAKPGQKNAADPVGDICLLPEIAGFAH